ncbi:MULTISPECIES: alpha-hydroxy acid oxidase [unclassified Mesorhizobium]|uniref:alpha-hydroxy acid oxidase n=1 Tax=unclassified Mesorhizobium TaxID=325217 RepID=UPI000463F942|nr:MULTISPECIES: alpha-hydroxy acid oxidase [unclassified Mesorhizobium]
MITSVFEGFRNCTAKSLYLRDQGRWNKVLSKSLDFQNFAEVRAIAKRRLPRGIFEYIDRGAEDERALTSNRLAFDRVKIQPYVLRGEAKPRSTSVSLFGSEYAAPLIVTPTAFAGLVQYRGEIELAQAAAEFGIPFCAATEAITSVEEIAHASPTPIWFQLYLWDNEAVSYELMDRAWSKGARTLVLTADTPVMPKREFNRRNGFDIPFRFSSRNIVDVALHPGWACGVLGRYMVTTGLPNFANYPLQYRKNLLKRGGGPSLSLMPELSWNHVCQVRKHWKGNLIVKGILRKEDALKAMDVGAEGVVISNHGGRMFDSAVPPIEVLREIADSVGHKLTVLADSSIQRGSDIFKLIAAGAKAVLVGRSMLYATAAGGRQGAMQMMQILSDELAMTMDLSGCRTLADIDESLLFRGQY